ncbi:hypothetical protein BCR39DRAFT_541378 [Naematelia encephala]|uniref:Uncharacterized protein n=1 Tax=Naematelia encephala TaxID=71784 RepID=A0A1Y2AVL3_9TREE|nr:hypothetical protein BCR39DRAFT_541378 [Naematelia encephala]
MGRSFGSTLGCDRGRWVMTAQPRHLPFEAGVEHSKSNSSLKMEGNSTSMAEVELDDSIKMDRQTSEFSVSAYMDFTEEDEAIFDMSKPLVRSASKTASTPFNTPCIHRETIHRSGRVSRRKATIALTDSSTGSSSSSSSSTGSMPSLMCRLDSQVVAALVALESTLFTPELDYALGLGENLDFELTPIPAPAQNANVAVGAYEEMTRQLDLGLGLGLDMDIQNNTIYHLPVRSRLPRLTGYVRPCSSRPDGVVRMPSLGKQVRGDSDMLRITDLDTGVSRNVHVASLDAE